MDIMKLEELIHAGALKVFDEMAEPESEVFVSPMDKTSFFICGWHWQRHPQWENMQRNLASNSEKRGRRSCRGCGHIQRTAVVIVARKIRSTLSMSKLRRTRHQWRKTRHHIRFGTESIDNLSDRGPLVAFWTSAPHPHSHHLLHLSFVIPTFR